MHYFLILGRNPTLSIAEIAAQVANQQFRITKVSPEILILESDTEIDAKIWQKKLGGVIKIGKIAIEDDKFNVDTIVQLLPKIFSKIYFGFSIYQIKPGLNMRGLKTQIKNLAMDVKKELKKLNIASRWVVSKEDKLSSVVLQKNKLLEKGKEFIFLINGDKLLLGETLTCQAFEEYSFYDYARPQRPIEQGMLPPKLAKIMINLSQAPLNGKILDPFCGSGTILQEAARLGLPDIIGTDISAAAIDNTKLNLKWLAENYQLPNTKYQIFQSDVREVSKKIAPYSIDAIVTEPYLGPLTIRNLKLEIENLSKLYLSAFQEFKKILKPEGRIVIIFPVFKIGTEQHFLPILDEIKKIGWQIINPIPENLRNHPTIKLTSRQSIIYSRPDQKVLREIFIFKKDDKT